MKRMPIFVSFREIKCWVLRRRVVGKAEFLDPPELF